MTPIVLLDVMENINIKEHLGRPSMPKVCGHFLQPSQSYLNPPYNEEKHPQKLQNGVAIQTGDNGDELGQSETTWKLGFSSAPHLCTPSSRNCKTLNLCILYLYMFVFASRFWVHDCISICIMGLGGGNSQMGGNLMSIY